MNFIKENLYWLLLAIAFALMFWLAPKVNATPLDDFLTENHLEFPQVVKDQMKEQNLVAGAGVMNTKEQVFTVYFMPRPNENMQTFDIRKAVMQVAFHLCKKKIVVEYPAIVEKQNRHAKCWNGQIIYQKILVYLELFPL